jgi:hypothetical protein
MSPRSNHRIRTSRAHTDPTTTTMVAMMLERIWIPSPNYSGRSGTSVSTIVLHTAEGARTIQELGNYFASPSSQVSSHVGIDDTPDTIGEYVHRDCKAWTAANANPWSVQAELCAFAAWTVDDWNAHPTMLANTAAWIAEEAAYFDIPLRLLSSEEAQDPGCAGVCQHNDLGAMGGGHWDCGPGFPIDQVLDLAAGGSARPEPEQEDIVPLHLIVGDKNPQWYVTDLVTKRYVQSPDEAARIVVRTVSQGGRIENNNNGPVVYEQIDVDAIPTIE